MAHLDAGKCLTMLATPKYTDFKITCDGVTFRAHKFMLAMRSQYFETLLKNECKETIEGRIDFPEEEPFVIAHLLDFIYLGSYSVGKEHIAHSSMKGTPPGVMSQPRSSCDRLEHHVKMYIAGIFYGIDQLKQSAQTSILDELRDAASVKVAEASTPGVEVQEASDLGHVLGLLFAKTPETDPLRIDVLKMCAEERALVQNASLNDVLGKHEFVAWALAKKAFAINDPDPPTKESAASGIVRRIGPTRTTSSRARGRVRSGRLQQ